MSSPRPASATIGSPSNSTISVESGSGDKSEIKNKLAKAFATGPSSQVKASTHVSASYSSSSGKHKKGDKIEEGEHVRTIVGGSKYHQAIVLEAVMQKGKLRPIGLVRGNPDAELEISTSDEPETQDTFAKQQAEALKAASEQSKEQGPSQVLSNGHITGRYFFPPPTHHTISLFKLHILFKIVFFSLSFLIFTRILFLLG